MNAILPALRRFLGTSSEPSPRVPNEDELRRVAYLEGVDGIVGGDAERRRAIFLLNGEFRVFLAQLRREMASRGLQAILLKGAALQDTLYRDHPGARPMGDVDLLVRPEQRASFHGLLHEMGFENEQEWVLRRGALLVDLHVHPVSANPWLRHRLRHFALEPEALWSTSLPLQGEELRTLAPEEQFCQLSLHALRHGFVRLCWLVDLALLRPRLDLARLATVATRTGTLRVVDAAGYLLREMLAVPWAGAEPGLLERTLLGFVLRRRMPAWALPLLVACCFPDWRARLCFYWERVVLPLLPDAPARPVLVVAHAVREALRRDGSLTMEATGTSMLPLLSPSQPLLVKPCDPPHIPVGAIVLAAQAGFLVVHRVVHRRADRFWLKGDARMVPDQPIRPDEMLGVVRPVRASRSWSVANWLASWWHRCCWRWPLFRNAWPVALRAAACWRGSRVAARFADSGLSTDRASLTYRRQGDRLFLTAVAASNPASLLELVEVLGTKERKLRRWEMVIDGFDAGAQPELFERLLACGFRDTSGVLRRTL